MAEAFMGRLDAYATAIDADDRDALAAALERNLLRGTDNADALASGLVDYVFGLVEAFDKVAPEELLGGRLTLPVD
jgi:cytochrome b pre-mRNA-processing protein 3